MNTQLLEINNWLSELYSDAGLVLQGAIFEVIEDTLNLIERGETYGKRIDVSANVSVLMYESGTIEVHVSREEIGSTYETFYAEQPVKLVKIKITGSTNKFTEERPNSLIYIQSTNDLNGSYLWMKDSSYARQDAQILFDSVEFIETKELK
jgi:hypothetical protein